MRENKIKKFINHKSCNLKVTILHYQIGQISSKGLHICMVVTCENKNFVTIPKCVLRYIAQKSAKH